MHTPLRTLVLKANQTLGFFSTGSGKPRGSGSQAAECGAKEEQNNEMFAAAQTQSTHRGKQNTEVRIPWKMNMLLSAPAVRTTA